MNAIDLLTELHRRGVELRPDGERLLYRPRGAVSPELVEEIREHKNELVAMLSGGDELAMEREAIQAEATTLMSNGEPTPFRWSQLADSGLHHNDVSNHAEVIFLFALELVADPFRAREDCHSLPGLWAHYAPFWKERLPKEAFEELEARYRQRLQALGIQEDTKPAHAPKPLRPFELNAEGSGCAVCGSADYWVSGTGARFCLTCHPVFYKDMIAIGTIQAAEEEVSRPSKRRRAGGGRATR